MHNPGLAESAPQGKKLMCTTTGLFSTFPTVAGEWVLTALQLARGRLQQSTAGWEPLLTNENEWSVVQQGDDHSFTRMLRDIAESMATGWAFNLIGAHIKDLAARDCPALHQRDGCPESPP